MENEHDDNAEARPGARRSSYIPPAEDFDFVPRLPDISELASSQGFMREADTVAGGSVPQRSSLDDDVHDSAVLRAPVRQSLTDIALSDLMSDHSGIPLDERMAVLETQMVKRDADVAAYTQFLNAVRADGSDNALALFEQVKAEFRDVIAGTSDIRFSPAVTELGDLSLMAGAFPNGVTHGSFNVSPSADDPKPWTIGIEHSVAEPEHRLHDAPSRWGAVFLWLGLAASPALTAVGLATASDTDIPLAAMAGVMVGVLFIFSMGSRLSRHTHRGSVPLGVIVVRALGTRLGGALVPLLSILGVSSAVWFGHIATAQYSQALVDSRIIFEGYAPMIPVIALSSVVVFGTVFGLAPRRAARVILIALGSFSAAAGLGVAVLGSVRLVMADAAPALDSAFVDSGVSGVFWGLSGAVVTMAFAGPTLSGLAHRNGRPGAVIAASIGGGLGLLVFVGMIVSLSLTPTYFSAAGNAALLWGDNVGQLAAMMLAALTVAVPAEFAIAVAIRTCAGLSVSHRTTTVIPSRALWTTVGCVAVVLGVLDVVLVLPAVNGQLVLSVAGGALCIIGASVLASVAVDTAVRRPEPIDARTPPMRRIVPVLAVVGGITAGGLAMPVYFAHSADALPTISVVEHITAQWGFSLLHGTELYVGIAACVSAAITLTALRTVVRNRTMSEARVTA